MGDNGGHISTGTRERYARSLVDGAQRLLASGLLHRTSGNLSVKIGTDIIITPSGVPYDRLGATECVTIYGDGTVESTTHRPSSELGMHRLIYERTTAQAVVHTHSTAVVAVSTLITTLPALHYEIATLGGPVRIAPYATFGTAALAQAAVDALEGRNAVILQNHGAVCYGSTLDEAMTRAETLEWLCELYLRAAGHGPVSTLTDDQLAEVSKQARSLRYGEHAPSAAQAQTGSAGSDPGGGRPSVIALGAHIIDVHVRPVAALPRGQQSILVDEAKITAAGTAAGTAVALARFGVNVRCVGAIGSDVLGDLLIELLQRERIETTDLIRRSEVGTATTVLPIHPDGTRPALHYPGAEASLRPDEIDGVNFQGVSLIHIGGADLLGGVSSTLATRLNSFRRDGGVVTLDLLGSPTARSRTTLDELLGSVDWFLPNEEQFLAVTGCDTLEAAFKEIGRVENLSVAVTRGGDGCSILSNGEILHLPAVSTTVVDTTGCGDAFSSGFIVGLLVDAPLEVSASLGLACGGIVAGGLGSNAGIEGVDGIFDVASKAYPELEEALELTQGRVRLWSDDV